VREDQILPGKRIPFEEVVQYWTNIFTTASNTSPEVNIEPVLRPELWQPILLSEVKRCLPEINTAPGPDGISARLFRSVPLQILHRIFNIFLTIRKIPETLLASRTVLIPKINDPEEPGSFRPITVSSIILRAFHKTLANRLKVLPLDYRQRAFREADGCSENILLLDTILKFYRRNHKSIFVASLDVAKAFDSVSFPALDMAMQSKGFPREMRRYLNYVYDNSSLKIKCGMKTSESIHPVRGVKQGDPLSPLLFNFVIEGLLRDLPKEIGTHIGDFQLNALAFADDLILLAETKEGLQLLIEKAITYLGKCGLHINHKKSLTVAIQNIPKQKKIAVDVSCRFRAGNALLPALKRSDSWKYLGIPFSPDGKLPINVKLSFTELLDKLSRAAFKPQQRLWILTKNIIPGYVYHLTCGNIKLGNLRAIDKLTRRALRKWLHLPNDTPTPCFHTDVKDGGLGVPALRWWIPLLRKTKLQKLRKSEFLRGDVIKTFIDDEIRHCSNWLSDKDGDIEKHNDLS
jgi:hypothetical protein